MANEDVKCKRCPDPAFFRITNLRDDKTEEMCMQHFAEFITNGQVKLQQEAFKEHIRRATGASF